MFIVFRMASFRRLVFENIVGADAGDLPGGPLGRKFTILGFVVYEVTEVGVVDVKLDFCRPDEELDSELMPERRLVECRDTVLLVVLAPSKGLLA